MTLLARIAGFLEARGVPHALIGAGALAVHGASRATADLDLLVVDRRCLDRSFWETLPSENLSWELHVGDASDPLAGVARFSSKGDGVDVVVGRSGWQKSLIERAVPMNLGEVSVPVVRPSDLVLLKLFAGGPQDAWDISQLLLAGDREAITGGVERHLSELPTDARTLWAEILARYPENSR